MGIFSRNKVNPPPTTTSTVQEKDRSSAQVDTKTGIEHMEVAHAEKGDKAHHPRYVDPEVEKRVVRKLDWRIPPLVATLYLLAFLDRSNIGNARIAGMATDLDLTSHRYTWLLNIFYISYIVFEFFVIMWKVVPPHIWAAFMVLGWGLAATLQAATMSWAGEMACRFFLGLFEAGFGPGIPYLLSFYYLRHELGLRIGLFLSAAPLATTFAGALAYGITSGHAHLANWRLLFLVEGLPTLLMAPVVYFFLPDAPDKAKFLSQEEKVVAKARGVRQVGDTVRMGGIVWKDVELALLDIKCWFTALMYFSCNVSFSSLPVFLPTILHEMGFSAIDSQGLTAPPYFLSFLITIFTTWLADRTQQRGYTIFVLSILGGVGYLILATSHSVAAKYFGVYMAAAGIFPSIANILPWVLNNQGSDTRRGVGISLLNLIGQCGPVLGTNIYPTGDGPRYIRGLTICAAFMFFNGFLAISLRTLLVSENKKLDQKYSPKGAQEDQEVRAGVSSAVGEENYGANFRYVL